LRNEQNRLVIMIFASWLPNNLL